MQLQFIESEQVERKLQYYHALGSTLVLKFVLWQIRPGTDFHTETHWKVECRMQVVSGSQQRKLRMQPEIRLHLS